jgi:alpha-tubulin suppressor-like RCC1 family protein
VDEHAPVAVNIDDAADVALGVTYGCAVRRSGQVVCWGDNGSGQLGDGTQNPRPLPTPVPGLLDVLRISAGQQHTCAVRRTGAVVCWGTNSNGEVGDGTTNSPRLVPTPVMGVTNAIDVAVSQVASCVVLATGGVMCWGANNYGQLGIGGGAGNRTSPVATNLITDAVEIASTGSSYASFCARRSNGAVWCWGENGSGQLGDGSTSDRTSPVAVSGLSGATEVAIGDATGCARTGSNIVLCWGGNSYTQLLRSTASNYGNTAAMIPGITDAVAIAVASGHVCVARSGTGGVACWGRNEHGQVGDGTTTSPRTTATSVLNLP